jgi:hypothetical protein
MPDPSENEPGTAAPALPPATNPEGWQPVTRLTWSIGALPEGRLAPFGSMSFRGLRQYTDAVTGGQWDHPESSGNPKTLVL